MVYPLWCRPAEQEGQSQTHQVNLVSRRAPGSLPDSSSRTVAAPASDGANAARRRRASARASMVVDAVAHQSPRSPGEERKAVHHASDACRPGSRRMPPTSSTVRSPSASLRGVKHLTTTPPGRTPHGGPREIGVAGDPARGRRRGSPLGSREHVDAAARGRQVWSTTSKRPVALEALAVRETQPRPASPTRGPRVTPRNLLSKMHRAKASPFGGSSPRTCRRKRKAQTRCSCPNRFISPVEAAELSKRRETFFRPRYRHEGRACPDRASASASAAQNVRRHRRDEEKAPRAGRSAAVC
jgi:hypothetical protein